MRHRIFFYSKNDGSIHRSLQMISQFMANVNLSNITDVNDVLELHQILNFFDENLFPNDWSEDEIAGNRLKVPSIKKLISSFFNSKASSGLTEIYDNLDYNQSSSFWQIINKYKFYNLLSSDDFLHILHDKAYSLRIILRYKTLVDFFKIEIKRLFISIPLISAELILGEYEKKQDDNHSKLYFPVNLTLAEKENIIIDYINSAQPNANYLDLIMHSKPDDNLKLSDKTRLIAKKKSIEISREFFSLNEGFSISVDVRIDPDSEVPRHLGTFNSQPIITYGGKYLDKITDKAELFEFIRENLFILDKFDCIDLVKRASEISSFERIFMKSRNAYNGGISFRHKFIIAQSCTHVFQYYLNSRNYSLEEVILHYVDKILNSRYNVNQFYLALDTSSDTFLNKITTAIPQIDSILKQYKLFVEDGFVDSELLQMCSKTPLFSDIPSRAQKKYFYPNQHKLSKVFNSFFAEIGMFYHPELFINEYDNFYNFLLKNDVRVAQFDDFQQRGLEELIEENYLFIDEQGFIRIRNEAYFMTLQILYNYEVVNYFSLHYLLRPTLEMLNNFEMLDHEQKLFTRAESDFLNFILNKSAFTDGYDIRNKYMHGTNSLDEAVIKNHYHIVLMVIIMIICKIENDLKASQPKLTLTLNI